MSTISFEIIGGELILCYKPDVGLENIAARLSSGTEILIKHTFIDL